MTTQPSSHTDAEIPIASASAPLAHELMWGVEWIHLRASRVYQGEGVPHGHGEPVIAVPGFLGSYAGMRELTDWLERIGYAVSGPGFERNIACPDMLLDRLEHRVAALHEGIGRKVSLVGHSLGGSLARAAAVRVPEHIEQVITLGSPLREVRAHPIIAELARLLAMLAPSPHRTHAGHVHGPTCSSELAFALGQAVPSEVRRTAIFSRDDGVLDWRTSMESDPAVDVEVPATHIGLIVNIDAYRAIALALAKQSPDRSACRTGAHTTADRDPRETTATRRVR